MERVLDHVRAKNPSSEEDPLAGVEILQLATKYLAEDAFKDLSQEFRDELKAFMEKFSKRVDKVCMCVCVCVDQLSV